MQSVKLAVLAFVDLVISLAAGPARVADPQQPPPPPPPPW